MVYLKGGWVVVLVLFLCACNRDRPEEATVTVTVEMPAGTEAATETRRVSSSPTRPTTVTPTLRPTNSPTSSTSSISSAGASSDVQVRPILNAVFMRSGPGEGFEQVDLLGRNETAAVVDVDTFGNWYEIRTEDGREGWVAASVVDVVAGEIVIPPTSTPRPELAGEPGTPQVRVTINLAFVRSGPGEEYPVIGSVVRGSTFTVLGHRRNGTWFNVRLASGGRGWIGASVVERVGDWTLQEVGVAATIPAIPAGGGD